MDSDGLCEMREGILRERKSNEVRGMSAKTKKVLGTQPMPKLDLWLVALPYYSPVPSNHAL
jgi:hypothetical protein